MLDQGWIKIYRELLKKPIWRCSTSDQRSILIALLCLANHDKKSWEWKGQKYECAPGEFVTSTQSIQELAGIGVTRQNVRTALKRFEKFDFLTIESTNQSTKLKINNWQAYQGKPNQETNQQSNHCLTNDQPTPNQRLTTNKNDKELKKDKNTIGASKGTRLPNDWKPSQELLDWAAKERPDINLATESASFVDYWTSQPGAKGVKLDWDATFRNWIRRSNGQIRLTPKMPRPEIGKFTQSGELDW